MAQARQLPATEGKQTLQLCRFLTLNIIYKATRTSERRFHISLPLRLIKKKPTKAALETRNQRIEMLDKRELLT